MRSFLKSILSEIYITEEAKNGKEGLEMAHKIIPDLILSDVMMPEMDGFEFCRRLKSEFTLSHIPVILLTAKAETDVEVEAFELGADDFLSKPFAANILMARIQNLLDSRVALKKIYSSTAETSFEEIKLNTAESVFLTQMVEIIENNLSDSTFGMESLVKASGVSRAVLYKKIHAVTQMSISIFIRTVRLKKAAQLLSNGGYNVSEVAYETGFNDRTLFSKSFTSFFGKSPKEYLKENSKSGIII